MSNDTNLRIGREMQALGPKPEGAEIRFSEHVAAEILAGRFKLGQGYFDDGQMSSVDADKYRYDVGGEYSAANYDKKVFDLNAWREFSWREFKRINRVSLSRGRKNITDLLAPFEQELLYDAYQQGVIIWAEKETQAQLEAEAKRQRAAWWP